MRAAIAVCVPTDHYIPAICEKIHLEIIRRNTVRTFVEILKKAMKCLVSCNIIKNV